jgi:glycine reductase
MALSQGLLHDTYVMGENADHGLPVTVDPRVILDAGLVSGNCVSACDKNTSFHHRNNPLISELLGGHGSLWNLVGVVVTNQPVRLAAKESSAAAAVKLVAGLKAQGAIVSKEGFGNPDADLMMILRGLEQQGVKAVGITDEFAGADGGSQSLADSTPEADAIISTGNANEVLLLPPMETVIGPLPDIARLAGGYAGSLYDDGSLEVELQAIIGATNQLGYGRLRCHEI